MYMFILIFVFFSCRLDCSIGGADEELSMGICTRTHMGGVVVLAAHGPVGEGEYLEAGEVPGNSLCSWGGWEVCSCVLMLCECLVSSFICCMVNIDLHMYYTDCQLIMHR